MLAIMEILATIFESIVVLSYLNNVLNKKYNNNFIYAMGIFLIIATTCTFDYIKFFTNYKVLILLTLWLIFSISLYQDKVYKKILSIILVLSLLTMADLVTYTIDVTVTPYFSSPDYSRIFMLMISKIVFFVLMRFCQPGKFKEYKSIQLSFIYFTLILIVPVVTIVFFLQQYYILSKFNANPTFILITAVLMLFLNIFILFVFEFVLNTSKVKSEALLARKQYEIQIENYKYIEKKQKAISSLKHDMKNHLICIRALSESEKYDELEEYISGIEEKFNKGTVYSNTGNTLLDFIINEKSEIAVSKKIKVYHHADIPEKINISGDDLCVIIANLFDNAITAAEKTENGYIKTDIIIKNNMLCIVFENNFKGELSKNHLVSSKKNSELHGIGIKNIKEIVKKYSGYYNVEITENTFKTEILISNNM